MQTFFLEVQPQAEAATIKTLREMHDTELFSTSDKPKCVSWPPGCSMIVLCCVVPPVWRAPGLSDCQLVSPHSDVQLVPSVSRPAENRILPLTASWMLKSGGSQVGLMLSYVCFLLLLLKQWKSVLDFQGTPTYVLYILVLQTRESYIITEQPKHCFL